MLQDNLRFLESLDNELEKIDAADEKGIDKLYLKVFNTTDGQLVLRDLANRCFVNSVGRTEFNEGMRSVYLNIQTRLQNAVTGKKKEEEDV